MLTFAALAQDLAAFRRYIEDEDLDWLEFGTNRMRRPTYRYNGALTIAVESGEIAPTVAKRRMATAMRVGSVSTKGLFMEFRDAQPPSPTTFLSTCQRISLRLPLAQEVWSRSANPADLVPPGRPCSQFLTWRSPGLAQPTRNDSFLRFSNQ